MTRKDYILIAEAIRATRDPYAAHWDKNLFRGCDDHAKQLAEALQKDNPRFDTTKFLRACGVAP